MLCYIILHYIRGRRGLAAPANRPRRLLVFVLGLLVLVVVLVLVLLLLLSILSLLLLLLLVVVVLVLALVLLSVDAPGGCGTTEAPVTADCREETACSQDVQYYYYYYDYYYS